MARSGRWRSIAIPSGPSSSGPWLGRGSLRRGSQGIRSGAGFATQAARNGASAFDIMRQTGHRSITTVSRYVRDALIFRDAPASKLGL